MVALFRQALDDYQFLSVWLRFIRYMSDEVKAAKSGADRSKAIADARNVHEFAIEEIGANVGEGARVWQAIAQFEMSLDGNGFDNGEQIRSLALRRSAYPLDADDGLHREYLEWEATRADAGEMVARVQTNVMVKTKQRFNKLRGTLFESKHFSNNTFRTKRCRLLMIS